MAKTSGLPMKVQVDDSTPTLRDISNDILSVNFNTPRGAQDITGLDKSGMERLLLLADGQVSLNMSYNPSANRQHDVFKTVSSTSVVRTVTIDLPPLTTGSPRLSMEMLFDDYSIQRNANGELSASASGKLADGTVPTWTTQP